MGKADEEPAAAKEDADGEVAKLPKKGSKQKRAKSASEERASKKKKSKCEKSGSDEAGSKKKKKRAKSLSVDRGRRKEKKASKEAPAQTDDKDEMPGPGIDNQGLADVPSNAEQVAGEKTDKPPRGRKPKKGTEDATAETGQQECPLEGAQDASSGLARDEAVRPGETEAEEKPQRKGRRGKKTEAQEGEGNEGEPTRKGKRQEEKEVVDVLNWGDDLEAATDEAVELWKTDMEKRRDSGSSDDRTAFSMRERGASLRSLTPECFLGGCRPEQGGHLLYDDEGKINLHFLLATTRTATNPGVPLASRPAGSHKCHLRWMVIQALNLRLIGKMELKRGKVAVKRMDQARKNGNYSLTLESNLVTEGRGDELERLDPASAGLAGLSFPERRPSEAVEESNANAASRTTKQSLRTQAVQRQAKIAATATHNLDLERMKALTGPSFSFDWEAKGDDEDDGLEVDLPESEKREVGRRNIMTDQLRRSVSFKHANSILSNHISKSVRSSSSLGTPANSQEPIDPLASSSILAKKLSRQTPAEKVDHQPPEKKQKPTEQTPVEKPEPQQTEAAPVVLPSSTLPQCPTEPSSASTSGATSALWQEPAIGEAAQDEQDGEHSGCDTQASAEILHRSVSEVELRGEDHSSGAEIQSGAEVPAEDPNLCPTQPLPEDFLVPPVPEEKKDADFQISPTLPFMPPPPVLAPLQPAEEAEAKVQGEHLEISPTMPFIAKKAEVDISPTMPFAPELQAEVPAQVLAAPPTKPMQGGEEDLEGQAAGDAELATRQQGDAESGDEAADIDGASLSEQSADEGVGEAENEVETRRRRQEREWFRHKRRMELKELVKCRRAAHEKRRKLAQSKSQGVGSMTEEERSRYKALVSDALQPQPQAMSAALDASQPAQQRKPGFRAVLGKASSRKALEGGA
mmetsp:Transcript_16458/g.38647  ORF Transcript_16458/g.38647 Transcript_16458/m.38647 type:complete len:918 (-) Transcript_16458:151-2904(-)